MEDVKDNTAPSSSGAPASTPTPKKGGAGIWIAFIIVVVLVGGTVAYTQGLLGGSAEENGVLLDESLDPESPVATVDGEAITIAQLQVALTQIGTAMGANVNDPEVVLAVLNNLINIRLLENEARAKGYTATDAVVDAEIAQIVDAVGGEEEFRAELANAGLTLEMLREDRRSDILIRQLIEAHTDIESVEVTEEELRTAYDMIFGDNDDAVAYGDVRDLLYSETRQQKGAAVINAYVEGLRAAADVTININI